MRKILTLVIFIFLVSGCSSQYRNQALLGKQFPTVQGESLDKQQVEIPTGFEADYSLLLIGYKQDSQFDIDRWLIGLDMTNVTIPTYELPQLRGWLPACLVPLLTMV